MFRHFNKAPPKVVEEEAVVYQDKLQLKLWLKNLSR
jgi:hypothetical protein